MATAFVVPAAAVPSGGNTYDRRLSQALADLGCPVREVVLPGDWPRPGTASRSALSRVLADLPDDSTVLLDGILACGVPEVLLPHASRLRLVVLVHLPLAEETGLALSAARALDERERAVLGAAAAVVATGFQAARDLAARHGLTGVHTVAPGTDPAPLAPGTDGASHLLCVASVTPRKGHDLLMAALSRLPDLAWECVCVGPFGEAAHTDRVRALAPSRVRFTGPRTGSELEEAYAAADLLVLPSRAETYGMVVAEALARGVPVLATSVGGVPEALGRDRHGERPGLLVPPEDPAALADTLRRWLTEADLRARLRESARFRREDLAGWKEAARGMAAVLDQEESR